MEAMALLCYARPSIGTSVSEIHIHLSKCTLFNTLLLSCFHKREKFTLKQRKEGSYMYWNLEAQCML